MRILNKLNLPQGIVNACDIEPHNKPGELSATTLLKGVKEIILTQRHWEELEDDCAKRIWAIWGKAVHALLETEGDNEFSEVDVSAKVGEITVTGKIDNYNMETGVITDYKTASIWKVQFNDFEDWRQQGLIYAYLLHESGFKVSKCRFIALLKDHSMSKAEFDKDYPREPVYIYEFNVTAQELEKTEVFIMHKVTEYIHANSKEDDEITPCTGKERWASETKYAVMKHGVKRAVKIFDDAIEASKKATELGSDHYVTIRPGESKKCKSYCICNKFCNFYKNLGGE